MESGAAPLAGPRVTGEWCDAGGAVSYFAGHENRCPRRLPGPAAVGLGRQPCPALAAPSGGAVFHAPDETLPLYQASFRREGERWIPASLQAGIGRIGTGGAGGDAPLVEEKAAPLQHALPGGGLILALRTTSSVQGSTIFGLEIFRLEAARSQWRHGGTIPAGSDNGAACAPPRTPCVTLKGSPVFDARAAMARPGWPVITMSLDRTEERGGRDVTLTGAEMKRYGYDPDQGRYRALGDNEPPGQAAMATSTIAASAASPAPSRACTDMPCCTPR